MLKKTPFFLFFVLAFSIAGFAQSNRLSGTIVKKKTLEPLTDVNIVNLNQKKYAHSDSAGAYSIIASPGDTILFSSAGYLPDTAYVASYMLSESFLVPLTPRITVLATAEVEEMGQYRADSLKRREDYAFLLSKKHPVKLLNEKRPGDGPGLSFSPIGYFSSKEKNKRELKKRLAQEEEDYYVDYRFSASRVARWTGLKGDSLQLFMTRYRPGYAFCRSANTEDLFQYINENLGAFRTSKPTPPQKPQAP